MQLVRFWRRPCARRDCPRHGRGSQGCRSPLVMHSFCMQHQVIGYASLAAIDSAESGYGSTRPPLTCTGVPGLSGRASLYVGAWWYHSLWVDDISPTVLGPSRRSAWITVDEQRPPYPPLAPYRNTAADILACRPPKDQSLLKCLTSLAVGMLIHVARHGRGGHFWAYHHPLGQHRELGGRGVGEEGMCSRPAKSPEERVRGLSPRSESWGQNALGS
jgi:hypothetical protein